MPASEDELPRHARRRRDGDVPLRIALEASECVDFVRQSDAIRRAVVRVTGSVHDAPELRDHAVTVSPAGAHALRLVLNPVVGGHFTGLERLRAVAGEFVAPAEPGAESAPGTVV